MYASVMRSTNRSLVAASALAAFALSGCGNTTDSAKKPSDSQAGTKASSTSPEPGTNEKEVAKVNPRALIAHEGGLTLIDTTTGKVIQETKKPAFMRLSNAGDGRHVMVADSDVFRVYDMGIQSQPHGDHKHAYEFAPGLVKRTFNAKKAGHAVPHDGTLVLFSDGEGTMQIFDADQVASTTLEPKVAKAKEAHHGVALQFADGTLVHTEGNEDGRKTVVATKDGKEVARTDDCPGVHGEAAPKGDNVAVFGCENGPVVFRDGAFHKVKVSGFVRNGNMAHSHESPIVLADYKTKKVTDGEEPEHPTKVALIDSRTNTMRTVELGQTYWFRSLARGPHGEGLVLTADGKVAVIDPETGKVTKRIDAIKPWEEKKDWQEAGPAIKVAGEKAYVTDAENKSLVVIDLHEGKVDKTIKLPHTPVELAVVDGVAEAPRPSEEGTHTGEHVH